MPQLPFFTNPRNFNLVKFLERTSVEGLEEFGGPFYSVNSQFVDARYYFYRDCALLVSNNPRCHPLHIARRDSKTVKMAAEELSKYLRNVKLEPERPYKSLD